MKYCLSSCYLIALPVIWICSTNLDLRFSLALCDKEKQFRQARRERVMLGIKKLLDMEKPRFLPSSPEEVGTQRRVVNSCIHGISGYHFSVANDRPKMCKRGKPPTQEMTRLGRLISELCSRVLLLLLAFAETMQRTDECIYFIIYLPW